MKTLIVITGPTASGKSAIAFELAKDLNTSIISADSRQIYKGIPIGTAAPRKEERAAVPHFFVGTLNPDEYFNASMFEQEALEIIDRLFKENDYVILCGGSMMYIDAVVRGLDELPTISGDVRMSVSEDYRTHGLDSLLKELEDSDPDYYEIVDKKNHKRVIHAIEIIRESGKTYSSMRKNRVNPRNFAIEEFAVEISRAELYDKINRRVDEMIDKGLEDEARTMEHFKYLNSLNTVGFKEMFALFSGEMSRNEAIEKIKRNTRVYAKKQLIWLKKRPNLHYIKSARDIKDFLGI